MDEYGRTKYYALMDSIKQDILNMTIKVGEKLPSENELANQYGVSRDTVGKALAILIQLKLLIRDTTKKPRLMEKMRERRKHDKRMKILSDKIILSS